MMSSLLGRPDEPWPLSRAVDALCDAARRAGVPGLVWIAGLVYPSLTISLDLAQSLLATIEELARIDLPGGGVGLGPLVMALGPSGLSMLGNAREVLLSMAVLIFPLLILCRLVAGLARLSDPWLWDEESERNPGEVLVQTRIGRGTEVEARTHRTVRLRDVWRAGEGLGPSALGLWLVLFVLLSAAAVVILGVPLALAELFGVTNWLALVVGVLTPLLLFLLLYAIVLQLVNQLALHSLAHNHRGVASALIHAWRLIKNAPLSAARAALLELVLFVAIVILCTLAMAVFTAVKPVAWTIVALLLGFAGVTRAGFWARAYRDLGGLGSGDAVPGLD